MTVMISRPSSHQFGMPGRTSHRPRQGPSPSHRLTPKISGPAPAGGLDRLVRSHSLSGSGCLAAALRIRTLLAPLPSNDQAQWTGREQLQVSRNRRGGRGPLRRRVSQVGRRLLRSPAALSPPQECSRSEPTPGLDAANHVAGFEQIAAEVGVEGDRKPALGRRDFGGGRQAKRPGDRVVTCPKRSDCLAEIHHRSQLTEKLSGPVRRDRR